MQEDVEGQLRPLWLKAQAGDEAAYRQALTMAAERLRGYFRRRMRSLPEDMEDLVQETLLALHLQRGTYDRSAPVTAWMYAIARHKLIDLLRRRGRHERLLEPLDELPEVMHPVAVGEPLARRDLARLLDELSVAQRQAILDTKIEGLSVADAARRGGVSESAIKVNVHRGLKRLAKMIQGLP